jgi:hypothetical protein
MAPGISIVMTNPFRDESGRARLGLALAVGILGAAWLVRSAWLRIRMENVVAVTGSAKTRVRSDVVVWRLVISLRLPKVEPRGYDALARAIPEVTAYLENHGLAPETMTVSPVKIDESFRHEDIATRFVMSQTIEVRSADLERVAHVAAASNDLAIATGLANEGLALEASRLDYRHTKLSDIKHQVLLEAAGNARLRAEQIARATGGRLGRPRSATLLDVRTLSADSSNKYSDDESSIEKDIVVDVNVLFDLD